MRRLAVLLLLAVASTRPARGVQPGELAPDRDWRLGALRLEGNVALSSAVLRGAMVTRARPWFTPWRPLPAFDPIAFDTDLQRLRRLYASRGYYDASFRADLTVRKEDPDVVDAVIAIAEGVPVLAERVDVDLAGTPLPADEHRLLLEKIPLVVGQPFSEDAYDRTLVHLRNRYREYGYARVEVTKGAQVDVEHHTAIATFHAESGPPSVFGQVDVAGTVDVDPAIVRRELAFAPGEPFRQSQLDRTRNNLAALSLFNNVSIDESPGDDPEVDVTVRVTEAPRREIRLGVGYDSEEQIRGLASWRDYNFLGGARQLGFTARASVINQALTADFLQPHFPTHQSRTRLILSEQQEVEDTYTVDRSRVSPRLEWQPLSGFAAYVFYRFEYDSLSDVPSEVKGAIPGIAPANSLLSGIGVGADWSALDNPVDPTRGWVASATVEPVGGVLGGNVSFVRAVVELRGYQPFVRRLQGAARLRLGSAGPIAGTEEVPLWERLYAGGINSVRGYGRRRVGPLVDDDPVGGRTSIETALELRHPITETLGGVVFLDAGQVSLRSLTFPFDDLRYGTGFGIRYRSPIGPLKLDLGFPLEPRGDRRWQIYLSVGEPF